MCRGGNSSGSLGWVYTNRRARVAKVTVRSRELGVSNTVLPWFVEGLLLHFGKGGVQPDLLGHEDSCS